jgi:hypothetical protein
MNPRSNRCGPTFGVWLAYAIPFTILCAWLIMRVGATQWSSREAIALQVLTWGSARVLWYLVAVITVLLSAVTASASDGIAQGAIVASIVFLSVATVQLVLVRAAFRLVRSLVQRTSDRGAG